MPSVESIPFLLSAGIILTFFFGISFVSQSIRVPSVLVFIVIGIAVAFLFPKIEHIHTLAEIGIVFLFFILGMEFPLARMVEISGKIWPAGLLDLFLNLGIPMILTLLFGLGPVAALTIGAVAYATSSSISAKLLAEQKRLANPEAEFILALLIFEDLVAPILVSFLAGIASGAAITPLFAGILLLKIVLLAAGAVLIGYYGFRKLDTFISRHLDKDFMPLLTAGIALIYAGIAVMLGLSEILGAFLAGMMLSESGRSLELEKLLFPVRDITLPFFFFWFGTTISIGEGIPHPMLMIVLLVWAVAGKVGTGFYGGKIFGLSRKVSWRAGLSFVPRGEFSAIIGSLAIPGLRVFIGAYILATAFIGVYLFQKATVLSSWAVNFPEVLTKTAAPGKESEKRS
jgi:CPA2 family monovalent cation:H+ antiporter-2